MSPPEERPPISPTGRLAPNKPPNIQNISIRTEAGRKIREALLKALEKDVDDVTSS